MPQRVSSARCGEDMFKAWREASDALGALGSAALVSPAEEPPKLGALAPEKPEELPGMEILGFSSEECLHPPLQIRALPGIQPVSLGSGPVISQRAHHADILRSYKSGHLHSLTT